jgi:hypothetical protein
MLKFFVKILILLTFIQACKEEYLAKLDEPGKILAVEASLTDEPGPKIITLSYAMPFNKAYSTPLQLAEVFVSDKFESVHKFTEGFPGVYTSGPFSADSGNSYTLHIKTKEGKSYVSTLQALQPKGKIDTVYAKMTIKKIESPTYGMNNFVDQGGIEFLTSMNLSKDNSPFYRFSNTLLIKYNSANTTTGAFFFCWLTYSADAFLNLMSQDNHSTEAQHVLGFIPSDPVYYGIENRAVNNSQAYYNLEESVYSMQISFKQFHINKDVFDYYQAMNTQLEAKQRIFEPVAYQFRGNMVCVDNPNEVVLGVFEVASVQIRTFILNPSLYSPDLYELAPLDIDTLPSSNCSLALPSFWK